MLGVNFFGEEKESLQGVQSSKLWVIMTAKKINEQLQVRKIKIKIDCFQGEKKENVWKLTKKQAIKFIKC